MIQSTLPFLDVYRNDIKATRTFPAFKMLTIVSRYGTYSTIPGGSIKNKSIIGYIYSSRLFKTSVSRGVNTDIFDSCITMVKKNYSLLSIDWLFLMRTTQRKIGCFDFLLFLKSLKKKMKRLLGRREKRASILCAISPP